jgi:hypothetical protein
MTTPSSAGTVTTVNPLRKYFDEGDERQADFAARCSRLDKRPVSTQLVNNWTRTRRPILHTRRLIERATDGAIPADAWPPARPHRARRPAGRVRA